MIEKHVAFPPLDSLFLYHLSFGCCSRPLSHTDFYSSLMAVYSTSFISSLSRIDRSQVRKYIDTHHPFARRESADRLSPLTFSNIKLTLSRKVTFPPNFIKPHSDPTKSASLSHLLFLAQFACSSRWMRRNVLCFPTVYINTSRPSSLFSSSLPRNEICSHTHNQTREGKREERKEKVMHCIGEEVVGFGHGLGFLSAFPLPCPVFQRKRDWAEVTGWQSPGAISIIPALFSQGA